MQRLTYGISLGNYYRKRLCQPYAGCQVGTSLTPRPITVVFGLGMRLHVHMHTTLKMASHMTDSNPEEVVQV